MIKGTIKAKPAQFTASVAWAAKFVAQRPTTPIQGGMRMTAEDGTLTIETFNENVQAKSTMPIDGDGAGSVIVSGRLLAELAKTFRGNEVAMTGDEDDLAVTAGRWSGTLPAMPDEWSADAMVAPEPIGTVDGTAFANMIGQAGTAASDDDKKPLPFHCVHLSFDDYAVTAYGTDGYRMVRTFTPYTLNDEAVGRTEGPADATLLGHAIVDASSAFIGPDPITLGLGPNVISLSSATREVVLRQIIIEGGYAAAPLIEQMVSVDMPRSVVVPVSALLTPMKAANIISGEKGAPVAISVSDALISVHAKATDIKRKGAEDVDAEYAGPDYTMALNPKYLADALSSAPGDRVAIAFNEAEQRPGRPWHVIVSVPGDDAWRHALAPIKLPVA